MKKHMKRISMPKEWPLPKKGTKYLIRPLTGKGKYAMPLLAILRDVLKIGKTKKEIREILKDKNVLVDNKIIGDLSYPIGFFDIITMPKADLYYRIEFAPNGKLTFVKINKSESESKPCKIVNKTLLKGNKMQVNLYDGKNILYKEKTVINDSVLIDLKNNKVIKLLPLKENAKVHVVKGKHKGEKGEIKNVEGNLITVKTDNEEIKIARENLFVVG